MPLFNQSSRTISGTVAEIADIAGASADGEMRTRALRSLNAAIKYFNGKYKWDFLWTEGTPVAVTGPFGLSVTASSGGVSATASAGHGVEIDDILSGGPFLVGTRVTATGSTAIGFNRAITTAAGNQAISVTATRDMYAVPSDWRTAYSLRLLGSQKWIYPVSRRTFDRSVSNEFTTSTPEGYDRFVIGAKGKIRLLRAPSASDTLMLRYWRRLTTGSATGDTATLDFPADYDDYLVAFAKWHFLTDKGEGRGEQATTWLSLSKEGLQTMIADQAVQPDEEPGITPGHVSGALALGPNSTRLVNWDYAGA